MIAPIPDRQSDTPALLRLGRLGAGPADIAVLAAAATDKRLARARRDLLTEGREVSETRLMLGGWAARTRILLDGRRQLLGFLLPGDLIGRCDQPRALAFTTVVALSDVTWCVAPSLDQAPGLRDAYAMSGAMGEAHLLGHVVRLGRLNALERTGDLFLEVHERLSLAGLVVADGFELPLTQEMLADALGLTSVHVNRMLQQLRRDGDLTWHGGRATIPDPAALARKVGRGPVRVSANP